MSIVIREADLVQDQDILIKTLNENRVHDTDESRYRWRYLDNPQGRAKAWLAIDDKSGAVAGFTVVHPRVMCIEDKEMICWNCGDFSINKKYRTLGVAIKLRSAATQCVDRGEVPLLYAHPNDRMTLIHMKAGHRVLGQMVRYARSLSFDRYLPTFLKGSPVSFGLRWAYRKGLSVLKGTSRFRRSFRCELHDGFWEDAPYQDLMDTARKDLKIVGLRDMNFLKWRYGEKPSLKVSTLLLFKEDVLAAYAFFSWKDRVIQVHDLFSLREDGVRNGLIAHLTEVAYSLKAEAISIVLLESNPFILSLLQNGYFLRPDRSSVIVHHTPGLAWGGLLQEKENWFMTVGDRDV